MRSTSVERNRDVAVVMARLGIVQAHAIDEHQHLAEVRAAHGEVGLHAGDPPHPNVNRCRQSQHIGDDCTGNAGDLCLVMIVIRASDGAELDRPRGGGDHDRLPKTVAGQRRTKARKPDDTFASWTDSRSHGISALLPRCGHFDDLYSTSHPRTVAPSQRQKWLISRILMRPYHIETSCVSKTS